MTLQESRVTILVKALPQPSKSHGETVCCAGVTAGRQWKRLFPVRYRQLSGESSFRRWDWIKFRYSVPSHDDRPESCRVHEDSIALDGDLPKSQRAALLEPMVQPSIRAAAEQGYSLALIRPRNALFYFRTRSHSEIEQQKGAFRRAAAQTSFLDRELAALEPTPFEFRFKFEDETKHDFESGDWESHAMFYKARRRGESEKQVLDRMS